MWFSNTRFTPPCATIRQRAPAAIADERGKRRHHTLLEIGETFTTEKTRIGLRGIGPRIRHVPDPGLHVGDVVEAVAAADFFEFRHHFQRRCPSRSKDESGGGARARQAGAHRAIELDLSQHLALTARLILSVGGQSDDARIGNRRTVVPQIRGFRMSQQIDPSAVRFAEHLGTPLRHDHFVSSFWTDER